MTRSIPVAPFDGVADVWDYIHLSTDGMPNLPVKVVGVAAGDYDPPRYIVQYLNKTGKLALGYSVEVKPCKS
ncbi:hypothetical protein J5N58_08130 [Rhizobium cremeum]|uniref:hypothetical protein n=1 Tax=Rhizobium cremeum TaxID=2813827 RepID=UPI001FD28F73|nr:hypothetical protein [Rhizobium cremeum]MCJ7995888.1 hypothetical protein [Rhizobium cremeum]MCJ7999643.1 hypothetical protein [Rhizobium cremeum]